MAQEDQNRVNHVNRHFGDSKKTSSAYIQAGHTVLDQSANIDTMKVHDEPNAMH